jgi:2-polyprenyl-3-methyl-5-hydroxy-6-metoxy-1,4-benzoquinol methylase
MEHDKIRQYYETLYKSRGDAAFVCDRERYLDWLRLVPKHDLAQARLLDIGCGSGSFLEFMKAQGCTVAGTDISDAALAIARQRVPDGTYVPARPDSRLDFEDRSFDLVTSFGVLEHIPGAPTLVREAWRVLKPGGFAVFVVPNSGSPYYSLGRGTGQIEETPRSLEEWRSMFRSAGFEPAGLRRDRGPTLRFGMPIRTALKTVANRIIAVGPVKFTYQFAFTLRRPV